MKSFLICLLSLYVATSAYARDFYVRNSAIDIEQYRYFIELNDQNSQIKVKAVVRLRSVQSINAIELDLGGVDQSGKGMLVSAVSLLNQKLAYQQMGDKLKLQLPSASKVNDELELVIEYEGEPRSGLHISKNKFGERVFFADNWPDQGRHHEYLY